MATSLIGIYDQVTFSLKTQMKALSALQEQAATGSRVNRPSDDPLAARNILTLNSQVRTLGNYSLAIDNVVDSLFTCSKILSADDSGVDKNLTEARKLMTQAIGGLMNRDQQQINARAINELLEGMVSFANHQHLENYIFGGARTETPPYIAERSSGTITAVNYVGSMETRNIDVAPGVQASAFMVGKNTFGGTGTGQAVFPTEGT